MNVLMVVAPLEFRDEELLEPMRALVAAGHSVTITSARRGRCTGVHGAEIEATVAMTDVESDRSDAVVFVGGPGATIFFDDLEAHRLAREFHDAGKPVGAICLAPVILARAGVLTSRRATVFESQQSELLKCHALLRHLGVVVDDDLITASGPEHARAFGEKLVHALATAHLAPGPRAGGERSPLTSR